MKKVKLKFTKGRFESFRNWCKFIKKEKKFLILKILEEMGLEKVEIANVGIWGRMLSHCGLEIEFRNDKEQKVLVRKQGLGYYETVISTINGIEEILLQADSKRVEIVRLPKGNVYNLTCYRTTNISTLQYSKVNQVSETIEGYENISYEKLRALGEFLVTAKEEQWKIA